MARILGFEKQKAESCYIISEAPYSSRVHFGARRKDGSKMPARPWLQIAISQFLFAHSFKSNYLTSHSIKKAFELMAEAFLIYERESLKSPIWKWDKITERKDGTTVLSPRDIFDSGELYNSQKIKWL